MFGLPWDPFSQLASEAAKLIAQGWIAVMLSLWNGGLWLLRLVLNFMDAFLTPDLSEDGPGAQLYRTTFWLGAALMLVLSVVQLGVAAVRRDGKSLARLLIGTAQFAMVWVAFLTYTVTLVAAAGGLTRALMEALLNVTKWAEWQPWTPFEVQTITDAVLATVLGMMGIFLLLSAIAHFFIMITRGAALLVLVATAPIAAAGLVGELGRSWFWKTFRWLHAAAFTPPMVVLVMGVGVQLANGVAIGTADGIESSVGTAFPAVMLIAASVVSPLALFKMLSFVDPGTATGAAVRTGLAASGGLQGLLAGNRSTGSSAASSSTSEGRSAGEATAEDAQASRVNTALNAPTRSDGGGSGGGAGQAGGRYYGGSRWRPTDDGSRADGGGGGPLGMVRGGLSAGIGAVMGAGAAAVAVGADQANQSGVGHNAYYPDHTAGGGHRPHPTQTGAHTPSGGSGGVPGSGGGGGAGCDEPAGGAAVDGPTPTGEAAPVRVGVQGAGPAGGRPFSGSAERPPDPKPIQPDVECDDPASF